MAEDLYGIKAVSRARFEALTFARHPFAVSMADEQEYYSDSNENVLGVITLDATDRDWAVVLLGRDERGVFRGMEVEVSTPHIDEGRKLLFRKIREYVETGQTVFPQGEHARRKNEIFRSRVPESELHPHFVVLRAGEGYSPARGIIEEIAFVYVDLDGNFIQQFQTAGFNSRLWELYLYGYFHEELFILEDRTPPDFNCIKANLPIHVEAVTVNPSPGFDIERPPETAEEKERLLRDYMPIKFGSPLYSKLQKRYWTLPHVQGHPLIIAVHDFHSRDSMVWTSSALPAYLYGRRFRATSLYDPSGRPLIISERIYEHRVGDKMIASGFFYQEDANHISAVLFSNSATISKFNRMGKLAGFGSSRVKMIRVGTCYDHAPDATEPKRFSFEVEPGQYRETWAEGLSMFHNPQALHPVDPELFPSIAHHFLDGEAMRSFIPPFHPYGSRTIIITPRDDV